MPASVAKPDARPWLRLREAISSMSGPGVAVSARQATAKRASVGKSSMSSGRQCPVHQCRLSGTEIGRAELREVRIVEARVAVERGEGGVGLGECREGGDPCQALAQKARAALGVGRLQ